MQMAPSPPLINMPIQSMQQQQQQQPHLSQQQPQQQSQQQQQPPLTDRFGLMGLLGVIRMTDQDVNTLALGCDLTSLGMNLNSAEYVVSTLMIFSHSNPFMMIL
jgi:CCR4-NOT transcription complex subunit 2